jgi:hypothetical protein
MKEATKKRRSSRLPARSLSIRTGPGSGGALIAFFAPGRKLQGRVSKSESSALHLRPLPGSELARLRAEAPVASRRGLWFFLPWRGKWVLFALAAFFLRQRELRATSRCSPTKIGKATKKPIASGLPPVTHGRHKRRGPRRPAGASRAFGIEGRDSSSSRPAFRRAPGSQLGLQVFRGIGWRLSGANPAGRFSAGATRRSFSGS